LTRPSFVGFTPIGSVNATHFLLEYDSMRAGDFAPLRFVPKDKGVVVARLGGDEFVVVQIGVCSKDQAEDLASRLTSAVTAPMKFKEQSIIATVSVGVALAPEDGNDPERLLKCADLALYRAKADGRNCIRFFRPEMAPRFVVWCFWYEPTIVNAKPIRRLRYRLLRAGPRAAISAKLRCCRHHCRTSSGGVCQS
jgi:hypothetical protein